jgi:hypothetical protein
MTNPGLMSDSSFEGAESSHHLAHFGAILGCDGAASAIDGWHHSILTASGGTRDGKPRRTRTTSPPVVACHVPGSR